MKDYGFMNIETSKDLFKILEYNYKTLEEEENVYNYMNFIFVANQLRDWIKKDTMYSQKAKREAIRIIDNSNYWIINDIANKVKHFAWDRNHLNHRHHSTRDRYIPGMNYAELDFSNFSFGKREFLVEVNEKQIELFLECEKLFVMYKKFFEGILK